MSINRAFSFIEVKSVSEDERVIRGVATTPSPDRVGDIVEPLGVKFKNPMPLLHQHVHSSPVGTVKFSKPTKDGIEFEARLPVIKTPGPLKDRVDTAWEEVKAGLVRAVSIGFRVLEDGYEVLKTGGLRFIKTECMELSLVTIPANADATITSVKSIDAALRAVNKPDVSGSKIKQVSIRSPEMDKITKFKEALAAKMAELEALMDASTDATLDADDSTKYDELKGEVKSLEVHIARLEEIEALKASSAKKVEGDTEKKGSESRTFATVKAPKALDKGIGFARYAMCLGAAKGDIHLAKSFAENKFGSDERLKEVFKAAVAAGTTTDPEWAGNLVAHNDLSTDFIEYLRPRTIIGQFGVGNVPSLRRVPFNVHIKGQTAAGTAAWVGEGYAKPVTSSEYSDVYLGWSKLAGISVITDELARFSNPGAESLVRDDLARAVIARIDADFINPTKAAGTGATKSPASITNGVTAINSSGTDADSVRADLAALWATADSTDMPVSSAVYITNSRTARMLGLMRNPLGQTEFPGVTMTGGTLEGVPLIVSNYVPSDSGGSLFILAFASEIFLADDGVVTLDASREASILMDSAPNMNSGTPTGANQMVSMFQTNSVALRAERYINWQKRRPQAVAYIDNVNWGAAA